MLAAGWAGATLTLLPWGFASDRAGERIVLVSGLGAAGIALGATAWASESWWVVLLLFVFGATATGVNSASGRAVMHWFGPRERGLALGIRQTSIPLGGLVAALILPSLSLDAAFLFLGGLCVLTAAVAGVIVRDRPRDELDGDAVEWTLRDRRLWRLCIGSGLYLVAQIAVISFLVLFLHDERGLSAAEAAAVLGAIQVLAVVLRIVAGRWSDVLGTRIVPLRRIGVATAASLGACSLLLSGPLIVLLPAFVVAGGLAMAWNGLSYTAAAELAGRARSGAAIGFQQTVLSVVGVVVPVLLAVVVSVSSWRAAYAIAAAVPLAGVVLLGRVGVTR